MKTTTSRDGTTIGYDIDGSGPTIVFVPGVFNDRTRCAPLAAALAGDFTVITYDRRGRGSSGDTVPYAIDREVEDLAALCGESALVFGYSSGGMLALKAAADGVPITRLVLFEAPFAFGEPADRRAAARERPARLRSLIDAGRPGDAVAMFQTEGIGLPAETVARIRQSPMWPALEAMAPSMVYDATITAELAVPTAPMAAVEIPTLVVNGTGTWPLLRTAAVELAKVLPGGRHVEVPAADHDIPVPETSALIREFAG